jgi:hypothetical protein
MKRTPESLAAAYVWWQTPEESLRDPAPVLRQILKMGTPPDYEAACQFWGEDAFKRALVAAQPGAIDERSWLFWHRCYGFDPEPLPRRTFL